MYPIHPHSPLRIILACRGTQKDKAFRHSFPKPIRREPTPNLKHPGKQKGLQAMQSEWNAAWIRRRAREPCDTGGQARHAAGRCLCNLSHGLQYRDSDLRSSLRDTQSQGNFGIAPLLQRRGDQASIQSSGAQDAQLHMEGTGALGHDL